MKDSNYIINRPNSYVDDYWLGLGDLNNRPIFNPLINRSQEDIENPGILEASLMIDTDYLAFTAKTLLGIDLHPIQAAILQELWTRPFPMFLATRGAGKCLVSTTPVLSSNGWKKIKDIKVGDEVYGVDGKPSKVTFVTEKQKQLEFYCLRFEDGRSIRACEDHLWYVWDTISEKYTTLTTRQLISSGYYNYKIPNNACIDGWKDKDLLIHPYIAGTIIGCGYFSRDTMKVKKKYIADIEKFNRLLPDDYKLIDYGDEYHICRKSTKGMPFVELCRKCGVYAHTSNEKFISKRYLFSSTESRRELLESLEKAKIVSHRLKRDCRDLRRSLGIYNSDKIAITSIKYIGKNDGYCISVDNETNTYITKDYIVTHNTFLFAVLATLKCALIPNYKIVGVGAGLRQSKMIFNYMTKLWNDAPVLRSVCNENSGPRNSNDRATFIINNSIATFLPVGDGKKIRGERAHLILIDEFSSFSPEIFETVVSGFAAVSAKPIDNVKELARREALKILGQWTEEQALLSQKIETNQIIITGTADYAFLHFAEYWRRYHTYIQSRGNPTKKISLPSGEIKTLADYYPDGIPGHFDWRDYSIIRIPYDLLPSGFMDDKVIARAKGSNTNSAVYLREYMSCFPSDSDGFFRRTLIESCVANNKNCNKPYWPIWCPEPFDPVMKGKGNKKYVIGIDPAAHQDNLAIVVIEMHAEHRRVVHVWSTNLEEFNKKKAANTTEETEYFSYCARKIRDLVHAFPCDDIVIDGQGGGTAIVEALHDELRLQNGEVAFWPTNEIMNPDSELPTDDFAGLHNIHIFQFAKSEHVSEANHGLRKDMEDKILLFPRFDTVSLELAAFADNQYEQNSGTKIYDTLEDCVFEIDSLKDEMVSIVMSKTSEGAGGRDRWDSPDTVTPEGKKAKMRKDRYSALVMANFIARRKMKAPKDTAYKSYGGFAHMLAKKKKKKGEKTTNLYSGPAWWVNATGNGQHYKSIKKE